MISLEEILLLFFLPLLLCSFFIKKLSPIMSYRGLVGKDMNKREQPSIPNIGGIPLFLSVICSIIIFLFLGFFLGFSSMNHEDAALVVLFILSFLLLGVYDDIFKLRQKTKSIIPFFLSLPICLTLDSSIDFIVVPRKEYGYLMFIFVPFGINCAANSMNMLEGFNGLSIGLSLIISLNLLFLLIINDNLFELKLCIILIGSLVSFLYFNFNPASIFPGDSSTLTLGAFLSFLFVSADMHMIGAAFFLPMIVEFFLKLRGNFKAQNFSTGYDGNYLIYNGKIESLTHILMSRYRLTETSLVLSIYLIQMVVCLFFTLLILI